MITADFVYSRLRKPDYTAAETEAYAARCRELLATGRDLYVMFKHEEDHTGALRAEQLLRSAGDDFGHDVVQQGLPPVCRRGLLRNSSHMAQGRSDVGDQHHQGCPGRVHRRQVERCLAGMFGRPAHGRQ